MKRRSTCRGGEGGEQGGNTRNHNKKTKQQQHSAPPVIGTVGTRTRHHKKAKAAKWQHPVSILINIFGYADPELLRLLCGVSKQFRDIIYKNPGMEQNRVVPLLSIRPSEKEPNDRGRLQRLVQQLFVHRDKLQRHREVKIIAGHKFLFTNFYSNWREEIEKVVAQQFRFEGVVSLDMSSAIATPTPTIDYWPRYLTIVLAIILPNLRKINLSNATMQIDCFLEKCSYLETITWNNIEYQSEVSLSGYQLRNGKTLKDIYMDNSLFYGYDSYLDRLSDLENDEYSDYVLFHHCSSTVLERVSIKNAKYGGYNNTTTILPQNALIKFVRQSPPSLRWFRSDLSSENMTMLRSERPEIEFVN